MFRGRQQINSKETFVEQEGVAKREALWIKNDFVHCQRCGEVTEKNQARLGQQAIFYCPWCIRFGRVTTEDYLVWEESTQRSFTTHKKLVDFTWDGVLTREQQHLSDELIKNEEKDCDSLVWAVTGAGKTEMIFPLLHHVLQKGKRIAICSPRIDVCRELYPRVSRVFPQENTLLLHGNSEEKYRDTNLMICTMHQLFYFYQAFDLIIVDEVDAFPYEGDRQLAYVCHQALKGSGTYVYLTATPSKFLLANLRKSTQQLTLSKRFHGRDLPIPHIYWQNNWKVPTNYFFKRKLCQLINQLIDQTFVLLFCPSVSYMHQLFIVLQKMYPSEELVSIHAEDDHRKEKVADVRNKKYRIVLSTTILERGVTFDRVSVIIIGANHRIYTKSTLVQIAGRVDRRGETKNGEVYYICNRWTKAITQSVAEIKFMNNTARSVSHK